jgi:hypothetical protein
LNSIKPSANFFGYIFGRYAQVRNVDTEFVQWSVRQGVGLNVKKSDVLTHEEEQWMLKSEGAALDHLKGLTTNLFTSVAVIFFSCMKCVHINSSIISKSNEEFLQ